MQAQAASCARYHQWCSTMTRDRIESFGGRRFLLSLGAGIATTVLTWFGKVDGAVYATVVLGTVGVYVAGNTYQKTQGESGNHAG